MKEHLKATALSEAIKDKLGMTEPLAKRASPSPGMATVPADLKRPHEKRRLLEATGHSLFHRRTRMIIVSKMEETSRTKELPCLSWGTKTT